MAIRLSACLVAVALLVTAVHMSATLKATPYYRSNIGGAK